MCIRDRQKLFYFVCEYEDKRAMKIYTELDSWGYRKKVWYFSYDSSGFWRVYGDWRSYQNFSSMKDWEIKQFFPYGLPSVSDYDQFKKQRKQEKLNGGAAAGAVNKMATASHVETSKDTSLTAIKDAHGNITGYARVSTVANLSLIHI